MRRAPASAFVLISAIAGCKRDAPEAASATTVSSAAAIESPIAPAAANPDLGRSSAWVDVADVKIVIDERTYLFPKHCEGVGASGSGVASGGAAIKTSRKPHMWVTGCSEGGGYFHLVIDRPPSIGPASASLFLLTLPGSKQQSVAPRTTIQITKVTSDRIIGTFESFARPSDRERLQSASGSFDVPRGPDDTSAGP